jgi:6-phosphogluconolactonase (cycloisomerase 2 family)
VRRLTVPADLCKGELGMDTNENGKHMRRVDAVIGRVARRAALAGAVATAFGLIAVRTSQAHERDARDHAVFVMTNDADANEVVVFERGRNGQLEEERHVGTGGRGSGGTGDPLASQGSLTLSDDGSWLFAANAGSGTVSVFRVRGVRLDLVDIEATHGSEPNAVAQHGNLVYVLNTAASSNVVGFRLLGGKLVRIPGSSRALSGNGVGSASLAFSPDGKYLVVTERTTNLIDVFGVLGNGTLTAVTSTPAAGAGTFAATFAPGGAVLVSQTGGAPSGSSISSYAIRPDRTVAPITANLPTLGAANCWNAITPDGRFIYTSNAGSSSISGFQVGAGSALTPIGATVVGQNPPGSGNLDIAISADGDFLFSLNSAGGAVGVFAIDARTGELENLGTVEGLPAGASLNGIAAN